MSITFDMGGNVLSTLTTQTSGSVDELVSLVRQLGDADAELQARFNGAGAIGYVNFKHRVDECANDLSVALHMINQGQSEMDRTVETGDTELADNAHAADGSAQYDAARFSSSR